jgi:hypothetical protein
MSYVLGRPELVWKLTYDEGMSAGAVAAQLGVSRDYVYVALKRQRTKRGLPALGMPRPATAKATRGRPPGGGWYDESPRDQQARIEAEVAAGRRCARCHLLLPCFDHGDRP